MVELNDSTLTLGNWEKGQMPQVPVHQINLNAKDLTSYWRRCSLSADFWAHYLALFVPEEVSSGRLRRKDVDSVLAYLLNELFENCAKFSSGPELGIHIETWIMPDYILIQITNHIEPAGQAPFVKIIEELLQNDPTDLYFQRLEANVELDSEGSGLGYLTLIKDFGVQFSFRFRTINNLSTAVDIQAKVSLLQE